MAHCFSRVELRLTIMFTADAALYWYLLIALVMRLIDYLIEFRLDAGDSCALRSDCLYRILRNFVLRSFEMLGIL